MTNGQVLTPRRRARHPISGSPSRPPMEARSTNRTRGPGAKSAHPSAATRHRACHELGPVTPIRRGHARRRRTPPTSRGPRRPTGPSPNDPKESSPGGRTWSVRTRSDSSGCEPKARQPGTAPVGRQPKRGRQGSAGDRVADRQGRAALRMDARAHVESAPGAQTQRLTPRQAYTSPSHSTSVRHSGELCTGYLPGSRSTPWGATSVAIRCGAPAD